MRISDWSSDACSSDLSERKAQTDLKQRSLGFTEAIFHVLVPEVQLAAAGLTIGVIGGQIDALRHLHGCTGAELPCDANRAVILAQRLEVWADRAEAHAAIGLERVAAERNIVGDIRHHGELGQLSAGAVGRSERRAVYVKAGQKNEK